MDNIFLDVASENRSYAVQARSDIGGREEQQDRAYLHVDQDRIFAAVCDGMGGGPNGGLASETAVSSLEEITLCCSLYDEKRQKIVLFIEGELDKAYINERISGLVPEYMLPGKVVALSTMPINANGKIDRVKLKEQFLSERQG